MRYAPDPLTVVTANGIAYTSTFQAIPVRRGMRMFSNEACASMGYGLPAAIGAAFAGGDRTVVCLEGDGSIQMNLQELQTVLNYRLPIKLFVYNNDGYLSIKTTQKAFFGGRFMEILLSVQLIPLLYTTLLIHIHTYAILHTNIILFMHTYMIQYLHTTQLILIHIPMIL